MTEYTLTIEFDAAGLSLIHSAKLKIVIVKTVNSDPVSVSTAWVAFQPTAPNNTITWTEEYGVYAFSSPVTDGVQIQRLSDHEAQREQVYTFTDASLFGEVPTHASGNAEQAYSVINQSGHQWAFGLTQSVTVNGKQLNSLILNAAVVPDKSTAVFRPTIKLSVGFRGVVENGVVITNFSNIHTTFEYQLNEKEKKLTFNPENSTFTIGSGNDSNGDRYEVWKQKFISEEDAEPTLVVKVIRFSAIYKVPIFGYYPQNVKDLHTMLRAYSEYQGWIPWADEDLTWVDSTGSTVVSTSGLRAALDSGVLWVE